MAGEDKDQKTEDATGKRISEAFQEGTFAKAPEIQIAFMMLASFFSILFYAGDAAKSMADFAIGIFNRMTDVRVSVENASFWINLGFTKGSLLLIPIILPCTAAAIIGAGLQTGFRLTPKVLTWKLNRLNPVSGFQNLISPDKLKDFFIEFLKFAAVLIIVLHGVMALLKDPIFHHPVTAYYTLQFIQRLFLMVFIRLIVAVSAIAAIHYLFQIRKTKESLKMSKQEVKDERRNQEGDPMVKSRQRAMARSLLQKQMFSAVPNADVVVTNPTHFAIALRYERGKDDAPIILAKGQNLIAQKIKAIAKEHGVPMVENKPVAQMLYKMGSVGNPIPYELYQLVAEILAFVYKTHRYHTHQLQQRRQRQQQAKTN
jgi:flagellar biosynthetic protein FlhB